MRVVVEWDFFPDGQLFRSFPYWIHSAGPEGGAFGSNNEWNKAYRIKWKDGFNDVWVCCVFVFQIPCVSSSAA